MPGLIASIDEKLKLVVFSGNTYPYRDDLKSLGARWNNQDKTWTLRAGPSRDQLLALFPGLEIEITSLEQAPDQIPPAEAATRASSSGMPTSVSVQELVASVRVVLNTAFGGGIFIHGIIGKCRAQNSRVFVDLADQDERTTSVSCVIWDKANEVLKPLVDAGFSLEPDLPVMFEVRVGLNNKGGQLSLAIQRVVPEYTSGKLLAQRDLTNRRLREEGIFDRNKTLSLTLLPIHLGILTSSGGTVINDFLASLAEGEFGFKLYWKPVSVQGRSAVQEIIAGLKHLSAIPGLDAILLFRGGGSPAELALFNDYDLAKAICLCRLPVISAIGHQEDQSSAQDVSFHALGVPKDVGSFFARIVIDIRERLQLSGDIISRDVTQLADVKRQSLHHTAHVLVARSNNLIDRRVDAINRDCQLLPRRAAALLHIARRAVSAMGAPIPALSRSVVSRSTVSLRRSGVQLAKQSYYLRDSRDREFEKRCIGLARTAGAQHLRAEQKLLMSGSRITDWVNALWNRAKAGLDSFEALVDVARPEAQLKRGFALVRNADESFIIKRGHDIKSRQDIVIEFHDAKRRAIVEEE